MKSEKEKLTTNIIGYEENIPIIQAEWRTDFLEGLRFYCQYCKKYHYHGRGEGHRMAHCLNPESPFHKKGYILKKPETR